MQTEEDSLKRFRQKCNNTMTVAAAILSRDGLQELTRLVRLCVGPYYDAHSLHASGLRGEEAVLKWYCKQAKGEWLEYLDQSVSKLWDLVGLAKVGLNTVFDAVSPDLIVGHPQVEAEDCLAKQAFATVMWLWAFCKHQQVLCSRTPPTRDTKVSWHPGIFS